GELEDHTASGWKDPWLATLRRSVGGRRFCEASLNPVVLSAALSLGVFLALLLAADRQGRDLVVLLALRAALGALPGLGPSALDELVHQGAVLLLVLVGQGVLVAAEGNDNVFLAGLRVDAQADGHLGHVGSPCYSALLRSRPRDFFSSLSDLASAAARPSGDG